MARRNKQSTDQLSNQAIAASEAISKFEKALLSLTDNMGGLLTMQDKLRGVISISEKAQKQAAKSSEVLLGIGDSIKGIVSKIPLIGGKLTEAIGIDKLNDGASRAATTAWRLYTNKVIGVNKLVSNLGKVTAHYFKSLATKLTNPLTIALIILSIAVTRFHELDVAAEEFRKSTGLVVSQMADIERFARAINVEFQRYGVSIEGVYKSATAIFKTFQLTSSITKELTRDIALLAQNYGVAEEDSAKMFKTLLGLGKQTAVTAKNALAITANLSTLAGVAAADVFKDIANASSDVLNYVGQSPKKLILATIEARRLGTSIESIVKSAKGMVNFQDSITSEMEASVLLGRNINMQRARELAWMGKINESREEALRQIQLAGNWDKMNVIQREKLAQAAGMEVAEVNSMFAQKKMIAAMDSDTRAKYKQFISDQKLLNKLAEKSTTEKAKEFYIEQRRETLLSSVKHELQTLVTTIGDAFEPVIQIVVVIIKFVSILVTLVGRFLKGFLSSLRPMSDLNTWVVKNSNKINKYVELIGDGFEFVGKAGAMLTFMLFGTLKILGWLATSSGKLGKSFAWVSTLNNWISNIFKNNAITKFFVGINNKIAGMWSSISKIFSGIAKGGKILGVIGKVFSTIGGFITPLIKIGAVFFKWIPIIGWVLTAFQFLFNLIGRLRKGQGIWESIGGAIYDTLLAPFVDIWNWLAKTFFGHSPSKLGMNIVTGIKAVGGMIFDFMVAPYKMAWNVLTSIFSISNLSKIVDVFKRIFGVIGKIIMSPMKIVSSVVGSVFSKIGNLFGGNSEANTVPTAQNQENSELIDALKSASNAIRELTIATKSINKEQGNASGGQQPQSDQLGELIALLRSGAIAINLDGKKVSTALAGVSAT